jgi:hypothetical protein
MVHPPKRLGLISDTHGLLRTAALDALSGVDAIVHAGDVGSVEVLAALRTVAAVTAVAGNMDRKPLAAQLEPTALLELGGLAIFALHDLTRLDLDPLTAGIAVVVHGHTHRAAISHRDGVLYVNPGSAGPTRDGRAPSVALLDLRDGTAEARIVELDD